MTDKKLLGDLIDVPAGQATIGLADDIAHFMAGHPEAAPGGAFFSDQGPVHRVQVGGFRLMKAPLSNEAFAEFVAAGGYGKVELFREMIKEQGPKARQMILDEFKDSTGKPGPSTWKNGTYGEGMGPHPVEGISAYEALAVARFFGGRLPNEEEWEHAARFPDGRLFPFGKTPDDPSFSNCQELGLGRTSMPGAFANESELGLVDLCGNVCEWTGNPYAAYPEGKERDRFVATPHDRATRGGSYRESLFAGLSTARFPLNPRHRFAGLGLRLAF